jgi:hypothetical protein
MENVRTYERSTGGEAHLRPETGLRRAKVEPERIELPLDTFKPTESAKFAMSCMIYDLLNSKIMLLSATHLLNKSMFVTGISLYCCVQ